MHMGHHGWTLIVRCCQLTQTSTALSALNRTDWLPTERHSIGTITSEATFHLHFVFFVCIALSSPKPLFNRVRAYVAAIERENQIDDTLPMMGWDKRMSKLFVTLHSYSVWQYEWWVCIHHRNRLLSAEWDCLVCLFNKATHSSKIVNRFNCL